MANFFHTVDTAATGAAAMWVFMVFVWPRVKSAVVTWLGAEYAKLSTPAQPAQPVAPTQSVFPKV